MFSVILKTFLNEPKDFELIIFNNQIYVLYELINNTAWQCSSVNKKHIPRKDCAYSIPSTGWSSNSRRQMEM